MTPAENTACVIYTRVSSKEQGDSGLGLDAQEATCRQEAERRGWQVIGTYREVISGAKKDRPMFTEATELAAQHHGVLLASKADRVSRGSTQSVLNLHERAAREGWHVFTLDMPEIDTTSPHGEFILTVMAALARLERRVTGERTKVAMAQAKARGVHVGRPHQMPEATVMALRELRAAGTSYAVMADLLNERGVLTRMGPLTAEQHQNPTRWVKQYAHAACKRHLGGM